MDDLSEAARQHHDNGLGDVTGAKGRAVKVLGCRLCWGAADRLGPMVADSGGEELAILYEKSIRLDPRDPLLFHRYAFLGFALLQLGRWEESAIWFERSLAANPATPRFTGTAAVAKPGR
jgi:tetratricopeptide (TPR) repeat protein